MKKNLSSLFRPVGLLISLISLAVFAVGCSMFDAPTASNEPEPTTNLWNPQPGDELEPGRPIPIILDENYWDEPGINVNPRRVGMLVATPVDGDLGGTVRTGNHWYTVPAGAVDGTILFTIATASASGIAIDCGPSPLSFENGLPVRITLSYVGTQYDQDYCERNGIEALDPSELEIWYDPRDGSSPIRQEVGRVFDAGSKTISVEVDHFSRYILA